MFETAEVGHEVSKQEFAKAELELRTRLLELQRALRNADFPVIVIVSGVETAGKSEVVNRLNEWLDSRGVRTAVFWDESDEERERPRYWRFWRQLPPRGTVGILFGSWYTQPIVQRVLKEAREPEFTAELTRITELERTLTDDGALIVKLWFHLSKKAQKKRLEKIAREGQRKLTPYEKANAKFYDRYVKVSEIAVRATDTGSAPWHIIEAADPHYRDLMAGRILLTALERRLKTRPASKREDKTEEPEVGKPVTVLDKLNLKATLGVGAYEKQLVKQQARLNALAWDAHNARRSTVVVFEGWDAAGKGGAIRRVVAALDARLFHVIPIAAPTDEERAQHYLWRFWRHLPRAGYFTIYDRSWYGRVLVERVEGFAKPAEWGRAYGEINGFEQQLAEHGICVVKFWLHLSPQEQLRRFKEREHVVYKRHKITKDDWRNRKKWDNYQRAVDEMVARTGTAHAPWTLVSANDKRHARITILKTISERLEECLGRD